MMSAKLRKNIPLRGNRFIKIQRRNAAAAALRHAVLTQADKNRRQMILLHKARGHNADNSLMPAGRRQHNRRIYMLLLRQHFLCLLHNLAADFLTQAVFLIQLLRNRLSLRCVLRNQQLHSQLRVLQTTDSIQPRRQAKADIVRRNMLLRTAASLNQGTQTDKLRRLHRLQATAHQLAVLAYKRHNIRHRTHSRQLRQPLPCRQAARRSLLQRLTQLKGNAHAAQLLKRIGAVRLLGVNNRISRRQLRRHSMVVGNDNIKALRRLLHLMQTADTAVHRNHQRRAALGNRAQRLVIQAVALTLALRNIRLHLRSTPLKIKIEQGGRSNSVHIVIAINRNLLSCRQRTRDTLHAALHILKQKRVVKWLRAAIEKIAHRINAVHATLQENPCHQRRNAQLCGKAAGLFLIIFLYIPDTLLVHHFTAVLSLAESAPAALRSAEASCSIWVCCSIAICSSRRFLSASSCAISSRSFLSCK